MIFQAAAQISQPFHGDGWVGPGPYFRSLEPVREPIQ